MQYLKRKAKLDCNKKTIYLNNYLDILLITKKIENTIIRKTIKVTKIGTSNLSKCDNLDSCSSNSTLRGIIAREDLRRDWAGIASDLVAASKREEDKGLENIRLLLESIS
jgi:hypothetical protein